MKLRVLLAEDDAVMRGLLKTLLEIEGYEVKISDARGENIFELLSSFNPHFLLLDYHLRNVAAIEIIMKLKNDFDVLRPVILIASGEDRKEECLEAGANGFLLKPYMPDVLISWLREREGSIDLQKD
jgi:CheY-like chemotaxis protein